MLSFLRALFHRPTRASAIDGPAGEALAAVWLARRGYAMVARNWRNPRDRREEIDLVCRIGEVLVFVEVKTRSIRARVPGYYAVTRRKRLVLRRAVQAYLGRLVPRVVTHRFDVIEVVVPDDGQPPEIRHFENVPLHGSSYRG